MSDEQTTAIDTGAEVAVPDGEVTHEQLVAILEGAGGAVQDSPEEIADAAAARGEQPAKEEAPKPVDERVSARIIANRRAELKARAERERIAAERAEVEKSKSTVAEQVKLAELVKASKLSPSKALELLGMDAKTFLETLATEHEPSAVARRAVSVEQAEREKLAAEVRALREERDNERKAQAQRQFEQQAHQAQSAFVEMVGAQADAFQNLVAEYTPNEIASQAWQLTNQWSKAFASRYGRAPSADEFPTDTEFAQHLESQAQARAEQRAAWQARVRPSLPTTPRQGAPMLAGRPTQAVSPRTLTNGVAAQRATAPKPWTQEDADRESLRLIQQMHSPTDE